MEEGWLYAGYERGEREIGKESVSIAVKKEEKRRNPARMIELMDGRTVYSL